MLTVHHLGVSQSERVVWLLEELEVPYKLVWHHRRADRLAPNSLLALHPAAAAPVIQDGELVLTESEAILPYICHCYAGGRLTVAPNAPNYADYLFWMALNNNVLGIFFALAAATDATPPSLLTMITRRREGYVKVLEDTLGRQPYLAGKEFTCADVMSLFCLRFPPMLGGRQDMPNSQAYVQRLGERPALIRANSIAGFAASPPTA